MTSRSQKSDTDADRELYRCLNSNPPTSFLMVAGAGSGKTTSLIKGLNEILSKHGEKLKLRRQKVACVTYTEIAAEEIWADVGNNPLVHVSTIHSFLWSLVKSFQSDISHWVTNRIDEKLNELREAAANFGPKVQQKTREKNQREITRYEQQRSQIGKVKSFTYGTGSDYVNGILGHDDIIKMVPQLIVERPLMRSLVAQQYPFLFVDESQDTTENVVTALKAIDQNKVDRFCLGFFGDPMQRIYLAGIGTIPAADGWKTITKTENFRCPTSILAIANAIRRDGDGLIQTRGRMIGPTDNLQSMTGSANLFILPIDNRRDQRIAQVRAWAARANNDPSWQPDGNRDEVKLLVIVHRMAATRLGFGDLYSALNDKAPDKFKDGFLDGTAWPVRPFGRFILPLAAAMTQGNEFEAMQILRLHSPLLNQERLKGHNVADRLAKIREFALNLKDMLEPGSASTIADVLRYVHESQVYDLDPRLITYLDDRNRDPQAGQTQTQAQDGEDDGEELTKEISAMEAYLNCPAIQFWGYYKYVNDDSPFSTQQGVKGAEFERVLVVLDDDEGTHVQFSYEKYFGIKPLSDRDLANLRNGKETAVERTRRLFYVCCTRALKDLVVVLFTADVGLAKRQIEALNLFPGTAIHLEDELQTVQ